MTMHPKTFQISLRKPLGLFFSKPYVFVIHAESREAALEWVARTFPGIDIEPTLRRWASPPSLIPGNSDPVVVYDRDRPYRQRRVKGGWVTEEVPEGFYRCSEADVAADLYKIFGHLQAERVELEDSFQHLSRCYERNPRDWELERLAIISEALPRALLWQDNVWAEYRKLQSRKVFVPPARVAA